MDGFYWIWIYCCFPGKLYLCTYAYCFISWSKSGKGCWRFWDWGSWSRGLPTDWLVFYVAVHTCTLSPVRPWFYAKLGESGLFLSRGSIRYRLLWEFFSLRLLIFPDIPDSLELFLLTWSSGW